MRHFPYIILILISNKLINTDIFHNILLAYLLNFHWFVKLSRKFKIKEILPMLAKNQKTPYFKSQDPKNHRKVYRQTQVRPSLVDRLRRSRILFCKNHLLNTKSQYTRKLAHVLTFYTLNKLIHIDHLIFKTERQDKGVELL